MPSLLSPSLYSPRHSLLYSDILLSSIGKVPLDSTLESTLLYSTLLQYAFGSGGRGGVAASFPPSCRAYVFAFSSPPLSLLSVSLYLCFSFPLLSLPFGSGVVMGLQLLQGHH